MPESQEDLRARMDLQSKEFELVSAIQNSSDNPQEKTVELLSMIANLLIENNFKLDTIHNELFEHTLALDAISEK